MARLNEFGASAESVESLKRRFVRQNREIARANSVQSVRVKDLEAEVARLLAENVSLREEVISLKQELDKYQGSERVDAGMSSIKEKLEAKLAEISNIVTDLGALPQRRPLMGSSRTLPDGTAHPVSPTDLHAMPPARSTRNPLLESDLPVIQEDKLYPRLSLESAPDIDAEEDNAQIDGPQPYGPDNDPEDPKTQSAPSPRETFEACGDHDDDSMQVTQSPPSLEVRKKRKRRDSSLIKDIVPKTDFEPTEMDIAQAPLPKAGSKRKFTVSYDEEPVTSQQHEGYDDFQFTRVTEQPRRPATSGSSPAEGQPSQSVLKESNNVPRKKDATKPARRALEPKSTNVAPKSPTKRQSKTTVRPVEGKDYHQHEPSEKPKRFTKPAATERKSLSDKRQAKTVDIHPTDDAHNVAKNPGESFSNKPFELNASLDTSRRQKSTSDMREGFGDSEADGKQREGMRHPRRSRGPVNYAEPNLRVKMRRPAEDSGDSRRVSKSLGDQVPDSGRQIMDTVERGTDDQETFDSDIYDPDSLNGTSMPGIRFHSTEREKSQDPLSSDVLSTLVVNAKRQPQDKRRSTAKPKAGQQQFPLEDLDESSVFSNAEENSVDGRDTLRQSRRHSSNPSYNAGRGSAGSRQADRKHSQLTSATTTEGRHLSDLSNFNCLQTHHRRTPEHQDRGSRQDGGGPAQRLGTRRRSTMV